MERRAMAVQTKVCQVVNVISAVCATAWLLSAGARLSAQTQAAPVGEPSLKVTLGGAVVEVPQGAQLSPSRPDYPRAVGNSGREAFPPLIRLEIPSSQVLFRLESEAAMRERIRQEARQRGTARTLEFPNELVDLSGPAHDERFWRTQVEVVEPNYLGYGCLYFQQINAERYGWDLGQLHPLFSTSIFAWDFVTFPVRFLLIEPFRRYEYDTGYALPGDPVPMLLYPPLRK
jgi:hypothetical protein